MPKRSATPAAPKAKAAKAAKVQEKKQDVAWQPALAAIAEVRDLSKACREMLISAVPHCAADLKNLHAFQQQVLDQIEELLRATEVARQEELRQVEQQSEELEAEKAANAAAFATASEEVAQRKEAWDKAKALHADDAALLAATADLKEKSAKEASLVQERAAIEKKQKELQQVLEEAWAPLKEGSATLSGKNWRAGRKAAERVSEMLRLAEVPSSLLQAVPVSLSQKVPERKEFANLTIEFGEKALNALAESYTASVAGFEGEAEARAAATAAAKEALEAAKAARKELWQASIDAENAWAAEEGRVLECKRKEKSFTSRNANMAGWRETATRALEKTRAVQAAYRAWRSPEEPAPEGTEAPPAVEAAAEAVAEAAPVVSATTDEVMKESEPKPATAPDAATEEAPPAVAAAA